MIGTHTVTVVAAPGDPATDISCLVDAVTIEHGRGDTASQPEASTASLDLAFASAGIAYPTALDIGSLVEVSTTVAAATSIRFRGRITDIELGWDEAGEDTPNAVIARVIAVADLASLGRRTIGDAPYPQELDGTRVSRVLTAAGFPPVAGTVDPGTVQLLARDVDTSPALTVAQAAANSAGGILWANRSGEIRYADADHRRGTPPAVSLDACNVLVTPTWVRDLDGLVNGVTIAYGVAPEGGDRPRVIQTRPESQTRYGRFEYSTDTELAALADATALASLLLTRNSAPVWVLTDLPLDMADLPTTQTQAVLGLELNDLVHLTGLPVTGSLPSTADLWVEGWTETLAFGVHDLGLKVSGYCRTSPPPTWDVIPSAWTWDTINPAATWDSIVCLGTAPPSEGRWTDVPASLRWDAVPTSTTWDTWI